jgi:hypothetical protein
LFVFFQRNKNCVLNWGRRQKDVCVGTFIQKEKRKKEMEEGKVKEWGGER